MTKKSNTVAEEGRFVVALDQGTTSSRAILFDLQGHARKIASRALPVSFPRDAWVEQQPEDIWRTQLEALQEVCAGVDPKSILSFGITNQRETTIAWDRKTGAALAPAIVWQCRRSAEICAELRAEGLERLIGERTGLVIDSYFSGSKIRWMLREIPGLREKVKDGSAVFGTVDAWLIYRLSEGRSFVTDPSNASRTMLCGLGSGNWDSELLSLFELTEDNLPEIKDSDALFAETSVLGRPIPVRAVLGDQQASLFGHGCWAKASGKCTFGTGAFLLVNSGDRIPRSSSGLLSTIAWRISGQPTQYALEGSVFVAGSAVQWLRDKLGFIKDAAESEALAGQVESSCGVVMIPAFVGLGAPHWKENVRGAIFGLTRDSSVAHIVRATLEGVAHQIADVLETEELSGVTELRVDGGMVSNQLFCRILAMLTQCSVIKSADVEATAKGAAALAALNTAFQGDLSTLKSQFFQTTQGEELYECSQEMQSTRLEMRLNWRSALAGLLRDT